MCQPTDSQPPSSSHAPAPGELASRCDSRASPSSSAASSSVSLAQKPEVVGFSLNVTATAPPSAMLTRALPLPERIERGRRESSSYSPVGVPSGA